MQIAQVSEVLQGEHSSVEMCRREARLGQSPTVLQVYRTADITYSACALDIQGTEYHFFNVTPRFLCKDCRFPK